MAKATLQPIEPIKQSVVLVLSPEEAGTLRRLLSHIGGTPSQSRRKYTDAISAALTSVGYHHVYPELSFQGSIYARTEEV